METPENYQLQDSEMPCVIGLLEEKASHNFLDLVAANARAMIMAGKLLPGRQQQLIEEAIAFTDLLIEKLGEKNEPIRQRFSHYGI